MFFFLDKSNRVCPHCSLLREAHKTVVRPRFLPVSPRFLPIISLLDKYGLENPALLAAGQFENSDLQTLYDNLVAAGQINEEEALLVGATIEDVDIFDLNHELELVDNEDITRVFENLRRGSENHLRAFSALLTLYGYAPYAAQFLTQTEIDEILAAPRSNGRTSSANGGYATPKSRMIDADGDGVCDFLQQ